jgi:hypothetical protein
MISEVLFVFTVIMIFVVIFICDFIYNKQIAFVPKITTRLISILSQNAHMSSDSYFIYLEYF